MKYLAAFLSMAAFASSSPLEVRDMVGDKCNADNCLRGINGSAGGMRASQLADCSSYLLRTAFPATSTKSVLFETTFTSVVTTVTTVAYVAGNNVSPTSAPTNGPAEKRQVDTTTPPYSYASPTSMPSYASRFCPNLSRYESACLCASATYGTTTAPTPVVTAIVTSAFTVTSTKTVTVSSAIPPPSPTPTSPITSTAAETSSTSTSTSTSSLAEPTHAHCDERVYSDAPCKGIWKVVCGTRGIYPGVYKSKIVASVDECIYFADSDWSIWTATFDHATGNCTGWNAAGQPSEPSPGHDFVVWQTTHSSPVAGCENH